MIRMKRTIRLGMLGGVVSVSLLASAAGAASAAQSGATVTGAHANEDVCQTMIRQFELFSQYTKVAGMSSDPAKRAKYFSDQRKLNDTLVKTAPGSLASDVALVTRNANASADAQLARDAARITATVAPLRSPEHLAAARRMNDYCGVKISVPK